jgi:hypothetical protein
MARIYLVQNQPADYWTKVFYTVDQAVGPGCPNRRDDVLLVQYFLRVARDDAPGFLAIVRPARTQS